ESEGESEEEETRQEEDENFDLIPRTPEESEEESNDDEEQDLRHSEEARIQEEEDADELYRDVNINQGRGLQVTQNVEDTHVTLTPVKEQVSRILPRIKESMNATLEAEVLTRSSHSSRTSYAIAADLSEMELKKILIEKMEGNKSIQRSDEQRNLYKAKSAFAEEHVQTTYQMEETLHPVFDIGTDDQPIIQTSHHPEWFSQPRKPPSSDRAWNTTLPAAQEDAQSWISNLARQTDARSSFNELLDTLIDFSNFIMHRLNVDTLTLDLLAVNRESARDVYSKRRIIAVTELQIMEWHNYKHLDWISVRR
nr:hypothetical protein [Tanacetum cinerariifolium]